MAGDLSSHPDSSLLGEDRSRADRAAWGTCLATQICERLGAELGPGMLTCRFPERCYLWCTLRLAWFGKGRQDYVFWGDLKREWDLKAEIRHYSKSV